MRELLDDVAIAGQHDPDIGEAAERAGEGGGNGAESADADEVVHLCGDEQDPQERLPSSDPDCCYARSGPVAPGYLSLPARGVRSVKTFLLSRRPLGSAHQQQRTLIVPKGPPGMQLPDKHEHTTTKAFAGLRVLDFSTTIAGPHCARMLADMGAEVIKIETDGGETMRTRPPLRKGCSTAFGQLNVGKKSLVLDLKSDDGRETVRRLAAASDILVENFRPGVMHRLRLDYDSLRAVNERLIYCSI